VLIPYGTWNLCRKFSYENGYIVLIPPSTYFQKLKLPDDLQQQGLELGRNALVFYEQRKDWEAYNPRVHKWKPATNRIAPLRGQYIARIPATTATEAGDKISFGFTATEKKGAGIRVYEYANSDTINNCRLQLEGLFWKCTDSLAVAVQNGMEEKDAANRKAHALLKCEEAKLLDSQKLIDARILNRAGHTICPLCLKELSGAGFFAKMQQATGREVSDLTVTELNLFHINELRYGILNHCPYNLGWGHHHCNVVVKDAGINQTLEWMRETLNRNIAEGYIAAANKPN